MPPKDKELRCSRDQHLWSVRSQALPLFQLLLAPKRQPRTIGDVPTSGEELLRERDTGTVKKGEAQEGREHIAICGLGRRPDPGGVLPSIAKDRSWSGSDDCESLLLRLVFILSTLPK